MFPGTGAGPCDASRFTGTTSCLLYTSYFSGGWATATPNLGYDVSFNPIVGINLNIPIFRWGARFKTNRQQKEIGRASCRERVYVLV